MPARVDTDVLVIGAGPAGASVAIRLASLGWGVTLVEQSCFPRQKVCGECLGPASLELLDELGLGKEVRALAGPAIHQLGWTAGRRTTVTEMPPCLRGRHAYGCAIGRDCLDMLLLERARSQGVRVVQPARVRRIAGAAGDLDCLCEWRDEGAARTSSRRSAYGVSAALVIDAHGSWQRGPEYASAAQDPDGDPLQRPSDLFAFKNTFTGTALSPGVLHLLCLAGGYGGMVVSDRGRTTVACCIRRDALRQWRARLGGGSAGEAVESGLRGSCSLAAAALRDAHREDSWHTIGPLRIGFHPGGAADIVRIGNAAAEAQPLIGEGICMALQSAAILARLCASRPRDLHRSYVSDLQRTHAALCRKEFSGRLRLAQLYARIAMQPSLAATTAALLQSWPQVLTLGARMAGKARRGMVAAPAQKGLA